MPRKVFFSFHFDDVMRANVIRNSDVVTRQYQVGVRFYDKSLWEETKKQGDSAIKRMINTGLDGSSVTCVLIGADTWRRPWVQYELLKSFERGNGILGVGLHNVGIRRPLSAAEKIYGVGPGLLSGSTTRGFLGLQPSTILGGPSLGTILGGLEVETPPSPNPLDYLGYTIDRHSLMRVGLHVHDGNQWTPSVHVPPFPLANLRYPIGLGVAGGRFSEIFSVYDWKQGSGASNFHHWVEEAARQAGR